MIPNSNLLALFPRTFPSFHPIIPLLFASTSNLTLRSRKPTKRGRKTEQEEDDEILKEAIDENNGGTRLITQPSYILSSITIIITVVVECI